MSGFKYFGTDGIRGVANTPPITADIALRIGQAAGQVFAKNSPHSRPTVVIGKDTRLSGYMLESALQAGFTSVGFNVLLLGPLPTPAVSMLTRSLRADIGVMITASHNPYHDNGIKIFTPNGDKLDHAMTAEIERLMDEAGAIKLAAPDHIGKALRVEDAVGRYIEFCKATTPRDFSLDGFTVVVDCAHGASYKIAPKVFWELGAQVHRIGVDPDGHNINRERGALHPQALVAAVKQHKAHIGIALDGDADRVVLCDETGELIDGDHVLAILATHMQAQNVLKNDAVVATVMSNMGLEKYINSRGLKLIRTAVGDHHVAAEMAKGGYNLGGESSGHIIMADHAPSGDGTLAGLQVLAALKSSKLPASSIRALYRPYPQQLQNVKLPAKTNAGDVLASTSVQQAIRTAEQVMNGQGRVLVRKSGTEPLIRVMVEAADEKMVTTHVAAISKAVEAACA